MKFVLIGAGAVASLVVSAADPPSFVVANEARVFSQTSSLVRIEAATRQQDATYPSSVGEPMFWIDASETTGWTVEGSDVKALPSKTGSRRLVHELGSWSGWGTGVKYYPPTLTSEAAFGGRTVLDFGSAGSKRFLIFDPDPASAGGTPTNILRNIGTIVQVRNSENGGGWLLGGGDINESTVAASGSGNYMWHRGTSRAKNVTTTYEAPLAHASVMQAMARYGRTWQFGFPSAPNYLGFNGGWETHSLQCTNDQAVATGIGMGDCRTGSTGHSGGFRLAEMLIYDRVLTDAELVQVEMYLEQKWFARNRTGWNGEARVGTVTDDVAGGAPAVTEFDVPAGTSLGVDRLEGGRLYGKGAAVRKTGAGALTLRDAARYAGTVRLESGTLAFEKGQPIPTADRLPADMYVHFDASDADSLVTAEDTDGSEVVSVWRSSADRLYRNQPLCLRPRKGGLAPKVLRDVFGPGKHVLDFGPNVTRTSGRYLQFTTNETCEVVDASAASLDSLGTVFVVLGAQRGGGSLMNAPSFTRRYVDTKAYDEVLYYHQLEAASKTYATLGTLWIDGRRADPSRGYDHPGYQVVAFETPGGSPHFLGVSSGNANAGGMRIAELIAYARAMDEKEIRDVQAYLSKKWFGRATPGYSDGRAADATVCDLQNVEVAGDVAIDVPAGQTNVVRRLTVDPLQTLRKTGDGLLWVNELEMRGRGISVEGGDVQVVQGPDARTASEIAAGATMHLDASDASTLELDGTSVLRWMNADAAATGLGATAFKAQSGPQLNADPAAQLNGKPVVDFGTKGSGRWLSFDRALHGIRSVYLVMGYHGGGGFLMGSNTGAPMYDPDTYDFHGAMDGSVLSAAKGIFYENPHAFASKETILTNGVPVAYNEPMPTDSYFLLELHMTNAVHASAFAHDRGEAGGRSGGFRLGEVLVYERELTAREKLATRNYLTQKWFGTAPQPLPEPPPAEDRRLVSLTGSGTFLKTGAHTLTIDQMGDFSGTLSVAEGTVAVTGEDAYAVPALVTRGLLHRQDATCGLVATTNGSTVRATRWKGAMDNGITAVCNQSAGAIVKTADPDVGGLDTVDMEAGYMFRFKDASDQYCNVDDIKSIFWIIGSQRGGGFLLGGGHDADGKGYCYWHRGQVTYDGTMYQGATNDCPLLHNGVSFAEARRAAWRRNGASIPYNKPWPEGGLSGGWDQLSMIVANDEDTVNAGGFAYDGRLYGSDYGRQGLAEVLMYGCRLTDAERDQVECYLRCKWNNGMHKAATNVVVNVAAGATFDCGDALQHLGGIAGAGTIAGSVATVSLVADAASDVVPTVTGTYAIEPGLTVDVRNLPAEFTCLRIPLVKCANLTGLEFLGDVVLTGATLPDNARAALVYANGTLCLRINCGGLMMIVR